MDDLVFPRAFSDSESQVEIAAIHSASLCDALPRAPMEYAWLTPHHFFGVEVLCRYQVESTLVFTCEPPLDFDANSAAKKCRES